MRKSGLFFLYPDSDPDHSQAVIGSKLDQDPSSDSFHEDLCNPVNRQINGHENNIFFEEVKSWSINIAGSHNEVTGGGMGKLDRLLGLFAMKF